MKKIRIIIADAQIEPIPKELWHEKAIINDSRRRKRHPSKILLYSPIHYTAMVKNKIDIIKRGRPDITQDILKAITNHPIKDYIELEIYVHTIENKIFWVNKNTRIPHNYYQFEGLMIQLLEKGSIPPEKGNLIKIIDNPLDGILGNNPYILDENGRPIEDITFKEEDVTFVIGAFQKGEYSESYHNKGFRISIYEKPLYSSTATCILLTHLWNRIKKRDEDN